jgi:phosphoribosylformimino-5-aminoimidazole carboxamide ribotide isomerase
MIVIPAIDLMDGKCVRLKKGDFDTSITYSDDPVQMAKTFEEAGLDRLHLVDLDGARTGSPKHLEVLSAIKQETDLKVDFGGGLRDRNALADAFLHGADWVTVGSAAIRRPAAFGDWIEDFGPGRFILAADVKDGFVAVSGWSETSSRRLVDLITEFEALGLEHVLVTDISRDGMLTGPAVDLYREIKVDFPDTFLIASGGVSSKEDLQALRAAGCDAVVVGKAIYEGRIPIQELSADGDSSTAHPAPNSDN